MKEIKVETTYTLWSKNEIQDALTMKMVSLAIDAAALAYAPYSQFKVGVSILMSNGEIVQGANQENASFPICICAESVTMGAAKTRYPEAKIDKMFIAVPQSPSPVSPCGMCRQAILEYERRQSAPIELYLIGQEEIMKVEGIKSLLPLAFDGATLQ
jgi:cytidine deaminase